MTIEKNRARAFLAALETLQANTTQVIQRLKLNLNTDAIGDADFEEQTAKLGSESDALNCFDDALDDVAVERNRYVEEADLGLTTLALTWKDAA
jgi:hypothetical protein